MHSGEVNVSNDFYSEKKGVDGGSKAHSFHCWPISSHMNFQLVFCHVLFRLENTIFYIIITLLRISPIHHHSMPTDPTRSWASHRSGCLSKAVSIL